jgi:septal ring factor EnvC (AmiA/AmiB activator)
MKKAATKTTEKYVTEKTFEKAMMSIAKSFAAVNDALERQAKVLTSILKEIQVIHTDHEDFRKRMFQNEMTASKHDEKIEHMLIRVEKLESKVK